MKRSKRIGSALLLVLGVLSAAVAGGVTSANAAGEHWYSSTNPDCGGGGIACALENMFAIYTDSVAIVQGCGYGYNSFGLLTGANCDGESAGGNDRSGFAFLECLPGYTRTGTTCEEVVVDRDPDCNSQTANPVEAKRGVKTETVTDFTTEGPSPLAFTRTYWSTLTYWAGPAMPTSRLGRVWRSNFDARLWVHELGWYVNAILPDGREIPFEKIGSVYQTRNFNPVTKTWAPTPNVPYALVQNGSNWELTQPDDTVLVFNAAGELTSVRYRGGYTQTLTWVDGRNTQVTDSFGRTLTFAYGANGRLSELTDPDGRKIKYTYEQRAGFDSVSVPPGVSVSDVDLIDYVLEKVIYPDDTPGTDADNPTVQYHYEDTTFEFALTGITDERGIRYATWTYDSSGRVATSQHAGGVEDFTFAYDFTNGRTTVTNPLGKQTVYHYNPNVPGAGRLTQIEGVASANCAASDTVFGYDSNGFVNQLTDGEGRVTQIVNDSRGLPTSITRGYGTGSAVTTTYAWHSTLRVPTQIVEPGLTMDLNWNANTGRLTIVTQTDTTTHSVPYSTNGQTRVWNYGYTTGGLLASVNGTSGDG